MSYKITPPEFYIDPKQALHVPPAPGMVRAAAPDGAIHVWDLGVLQDCTTRAFIDPKQALYVPPAPGVARAAAPDGAIRAWDLGVLQDYATGVLR